MYELLRLLAEVQAAGLPPPDVIYLSDAEFVRRPGLNWGQTPCVVAAVPCTMCGWDEIVDLQLAE